MLMTRKDQFLTMACRQFVVLLLIALFAASGFAQTKEPLFDLVIRGGRVMDPASGLDTVTDVGIKGHVVTRIAKNIDPAMAKQVVDARGMLVTPGLIDIHAHVFAGTQADHYLSDGPTALPPDGFTLRNGVTTAVDCGGAGWKNFALFKKNIIDASTTRVLSFLNIVGEGMRGGNYEQDIADMNPLFAANMAKANKDVIVGFKLAHFQGHDWTPTERVVEAGRLADIPVIIDFGGAQPMLSIEELFMKKLRPGDIYTHAYMDIGPVRETIVDTLTRQLKPFVWEARKRGIVFDVGYGGASFNYTQAIPAMKAGFYPTTISTDLHTGSMNTSMKGQLDVMSKFLQMGMPLYEVIRASSTTPAQVIKRKDLGRIAVGEEADIAVLELRKGEFGFYDKTGYKVKGDKRFECQVTIKAGKVVYDLNGLADPIYVK